MVCDFTLGSSYERLLDLGQVDVKLFHQKLLELWIKVEFFSEFFAFLAEFDGFLLIGFLVAMICIPGRESKFYVNHLEIMK